MKDVRITDEPVSFDHVMIWFRGIPHHMIKDYYFKDASRWWETFLIPKPHYMRRFHILRMADR